SADERPVEDDALRRRVEDLLDEHERHQRGEEPDAATQGAEVQLARAVDGGGRQRSLSPAVGCGLRARRQAGGRGGGAVRSVVVGSPASPAAVGAVAAAGAGVVSSMTSGAQLEIRATIMSRSWRRASSWLRP